MLTTVVEVLVVCLPVFAVLALGWWLRRRGSMSPDAHAFINGLVYRFSLPVIIFQGVARQDFATLIDPGVITGALVPMAITGLLFLVAARAARVPPALHGPVAIAPFWANLAYLGFPLAEAAYGAEGLAAAAIVNAFAMPASVLAGIGLLAVSSGREVAWGRQVRSALLNPVVVAAALGIAVAAIGSATGLRARWDGTAPILIIAQTLDLLAAMGLPLALLAVGASLVGGSIRGRVVLLGLGSLGKLVITPALAWLVVAWLFPATDPVALGTTVLLMAMPASVASYVIAGQLGADERFVASHLVLSTLLSLVTLPLWLFFLLRAAAA